VTRSGKPPTAARRDDRGFALVAVIWIASLLAVVAFVFTTSVRGHMRSRAADIASGEAEALADAAANLAILDLLRRRGGGEGRIPLDGSVVDCRMEGGETLLMRISDEAGRVDLNTGSDALIRALLMGLGLAGEDAGRLAAALVDYRDDDGVRRDGGAELEDYAGRPGSAPRNAPLESVEELARVPGFDGALVARLRPFVTVHGGAAGVDPAVTSSELAAVLARGASADEGAATAFGDGSLSIPRSLVAPSTRRDYRIEAQATSARGGIFVREAVVSLVERPAPGRVGTDSRSRTANSGSAGYRVWRWHRGWTTLGSSEVAAATAACRGGA